MQVNTGRVSWCEELKQHSDDLIKHGFLVFFRPQNTHCLAGPTELQSAIVNNESQFFVL